MPVDYDRSASAPMLSFLAEMTMRGLSPRTVNTHRKIIQRFVCSRQDIVTYLLSLDRLAPSTRFYYTFVLRRYLDWCVAKGMVESNPLAGLRLRRPPSRLTKPFSREEVRRMVAACRGTLDRALLLVLYDTGLRCSEFANLKWSQVDLERGVLRVMGKGGKERAVAVDGPALTALREQEHRSGGGRVWPFTENCLYKRVRRIGRKAGVPNAHPHRFRHTFVHESLMAHADRGDVRVLLGHTSWRMLDLYSRYYESERALENHRGFSPAARL